MNSRPFFVREIFISFISGFFILGGVTKAIAYELSTISFRFHQMQSSDSDIGIGYRAFYDTGTGYGLLAQQNINNVPVSFSFDYYTYTAKLREGWYDDPGPFVGRDVDCSHYFAKLFRTFGKKRLRSTLGVIYKSTDYAYLVMSEPTGIRTWGDEIIEEFDKLTLRVLGGSCSLVYQFNTRPGFFLNTSLILDLGVVDYDFPSRFSGEGGYEAYIAGGLSANIGWEWDYTTWSFGIAFGALGTTQGIQFEESSQNLANATVIEGNREYNLWIADIMHYEYTFQVFFRF